jgi:hypothetical protein
MESCREQQNRHLRRWAGRNGRWHTAFSVTAGAAVAVCQTACHTVCMTRVVQPVTCALAFRPTPFYRVRGGD